MTTPTTGITMDTLHASKTAPKIIIKTIKSMVRFCFLSNRTFNFFRMSRILSPQVGWDAGLTHIFPGI